MITGRDLIESQKLYSTGDDYLDELLERAFSDGYEYAQREFGNKDNKKFFRDKTRSMIREEAAKEGYNINKKQENIVLGMMRRGSTPAEISLGVKPKPQGSSHPDMRNSNKDYFRRHIDQDRLKEFNEYGRKMAKKSAKGKKVAQFERVSPISSSFKRISRNHLTKHRPDLIDERITEKGGSISW